MRERVFLKRFKIIVFLTILLVVSLIILAFLKNTRLENVYVMGATHYSEIEIKEMLLDKTTDTYTPFAYLRYRLFEQKEIPFVEYVEIEMNDRNTLSLYVYEKSISACIETMGGYLYFDKDGVIVESTKELLEDIAVIKGLKYEKLVMNEAFEVQDTSLFRIVNEICLLVKKNKLAVDTIEFDSDYKVTMYIDDTIIRLGRKENYDTELNELGNILKALGDRKVVLDMENFDKTKGKVIAKPIE